MENKTANSRISKLRDNKLFWAVLSLAAALLIWLYYTSNYGEAMTTTFYGVEVAFTGQDAMRDSLNLIVSDQDTATVNVTLSGSRRDITRLTRDDLRAVVNLSNVTQAGYRAMSYSISYPSSVNTASIREVSKSPSTVGLQISKLSTKSVLISGSFEGTTVDGYMVDPGEMTFDPASVNFTGPEEELARIEAARVTIARDDVNAAFTAAANFVLLDANGEELDFEDVQADADTIAVNVPVSMVKEIAVDVTLVDGGGARGETNVIKDIKPATIQVAGDAATLDGMNSVSVATIKLSDYSSFPATEYPIVLPNGVACLSGETTASVSLEFIGLDTRLFTVTNLSAINPPDGYTASVMNMNMPGVIIRAPEDVLPRIAANNIRVVADLSDVTPTGDTTTVKVSTTVYVDGFEEAGAVGSYPLFIRLEAEQ